MITFYGGILNNGSVSRFEQLNILSFTEFLNGATLTGSKVEEYYRVTTGEDHYDIPSAMRYYLGNQVPPGSPAIDWTLAIFSLLGESPTNYDINNVEGKIINFFSTNNVNSILPFEMVISYKHYSGALAFYIRDRKNRGIRLYGLLPQYSSAGMTSLMASFAITRFEVSSFAEMKTKIAASALSSGGSELQRLAWNYDVAPFLFYNLEYKSFETSDRKYSLNSTFVRSSNYSYYSNFRSLRYIMNWYQLINEEAMFDNTPVLYLKTPHNGVEYIELAIPAKITPTGYVADAGLHRENEYGDPANKQVYGFGYILAGTDLTTFMEVGDTIQLTNGSTITRNSNNFTIVSGGYSYVSTNALTINTGSYSVYITVSPSYCQTNPMNWMEQTVQTTGALEWNPDRCWFMMTSYSFRDERNMLNNGYFSGVGNLYATNGGTVDRITPYIGGWTFNSSGPTIELAASKFYRQFFESMYDELTTHDGTHLSAQSNTSNIGDITNVGGGYTPSGGNGGNGSYNSNTDNINGITSNIVGAAGASELFKIYNITMNAINAVGTWANSLFSSLYGVVEAIISLKQIRIPDNMSLTGNVETLKVAGNIISDNGVIYQGKLLDKQIYYANLGSVYIDEYYGSFLDYEGYTDVEIYLPFAGTYKLDTNLVMNSTLSIKCGVDAVSGTVVYDITVENDDVNSVVYTFTGNCANDMPVTYTDYSGKISGFVNTAIGLAGAVVAPGVGGAALAAGAMMNGAATGATAPSHGSKGSAGKNAGYAMPTFPYLIITRPIRNLPENYGSVIGYPSQIGGTVSTFSGFTKLSDINLTGIAGATDDELFEIDRLVKEGVYV